MSDKPKRGRPKGSTKIENAKLFPVNLSPDQAEKLKRLGGSKWIRDQIDQAEEPSLDDQFMSPGNGFKRSYLVNSPCKLVTDVEVEKRFVQLIVDDDGNASVRQFD